MKFDVYKALINRFKDELNNKSTISFILGSSKTLSIKLINIGLLFIDSVLLARVFGLDGLGYITVCLSVLNLIKILTSAGFNFLITREVAINCQDKKNWGYIKGLLKLSIISALTIFFLAYICLTLFISNQQKYSTIYKYLSIGFWSIPFTTLNGFNANTLQGLGYIFESQIISLTVVPFLSILGVSIAFYFFNIKLLVEQYFIIYVISALISEILSEVWKKQKLIEKLNGFKTIKSQYQIKHWITHSMSLMLMNATKTMSLSLDNIVISSLLSIDLLGVYSVIKKISNLVLIILVASNTFIAPKIAILHQEKKRKELELLISKVVKIVTCASIFLCVLIIFNSGFIFSFYGEQFTQGTSALIILLCGQIVSALFGPVELILVMSRHQKDVIISSILGLISNIGFDYIFIPKFGLNGVAIATTLSIIFSNITAYIMVLYRTQINTLTLYYNSKKTS